jgi:hypothetical protein
MKSVNDMTFEQFRKKFDTRFISEENILKIFNDEYKHTFKFAYPSKTGKTLLKAFCKHFGNIYTDTLNTYYTHYGNNGKNIFVKHDVGEKQVVYQSYSKYSETKYYIVANPNLLIYVETD